MKDLIVTRSSDGRTVTFELVLPSRPAAAVAVVDAEAEEPLWLLVADSAPTERPTALLELTPDEVRVARQLEAGGADPEAIQAARESARHLGAFNYGEVPPGFRQAMPSGAPKRLERGKRYWITVMGGIGVPVAQASFKV